ncbi:MAG: Sua5/YciO/YrdC/YwlC family protein [Haemophilus parainfluenzae]|nr:Sua5/YciO/YrdC/YwlC family protein [Haemophilus parainfluenzae]
MSQFFYIHPENPQARLINQAVEILRQGGVIVYPTDSGYALGCMIGDKHAMDRIVAIRKLPGKGIILRWYVAIYPSFQPTQR